MASLLVAALIVAVATERARAGEVYLNAAYAEPSETQSCTPTPNTGGTGHTYVTMDCPYGATRSFVWHFWAPPDITSGTFRPWLAWMRSTSSAGSVNWRVELACRDNGTSYDVLSYGAPVDAIATGGGVQNTVNLLDMGADVTPGGSVAPNIPCAARVTRTGGGMPDDAKVIGLRLNY